MSKFLKNADIYNSYENAYYDVESLFTRISVNETIKNIFRRIYIDK